ncbi:MAG: CHASE2 domain-containing protein, partial [Muribaculaceae bacterium]|nr:CHASE2 domain-containing protein [Muribaculaceae bacterium]
AAAKAGGYKVDLHEKSSGVPTGIIGYHSREIITIPYDELIDRAEELTDKIVLVGTTTEAGDVYSIPLRRGVSGLEIHAYSLSTILDGVELERMPGYIATIVAVVVCFLMVLGAIAIKSGMKGLVLRVAQIVTLYLLVRVGYSLFVDHDIVSDFSQAILMIAFGLFSVDLWNGTASLIDWIKKRITLYKEKRLELKRI